MARAKRFGFGERIPAKTVRDTSSATPTYSYDANGNRTNPGDTVGSDNQISTDGTWTYTYDKEGNVTEKTDAAGDKWQYTYDNANELVGATYTPTGTTVASTVCTYVYDVFGNKIEQEETVSGVTTITKFAYDGSNIWAAMSSSNALQTRYVYMDGSTTPVAQVSSSGTVNWYDTDYEGSVRVITNNSTGAAVDTITYDAYGNIRSQSSPVSGDFVLWVGGFYDGAVQLYFFGGSPYNPADGTWLHQDLLFPLSGTNSYVYCGNDPSNETDPTGLEGVLTGGVAAGALESANAGAGAAGGVLLEAGLLGGGVALGLIIGSEFQRQAPTTSWAEPGNAVMTLLGGPPRDRTLDNAVREAYAAGVPGEKISGVVNSIGGTDTDRVKEIYALILEEQRRRMEQRQRLLADAYAEAVVQGQMQFKEVPTPYAKECAVAIDAKRRQRLNACFTAGTPLLTPSGYKRIEQFKPGDAILTRNEFEPEGAVEEKVVEEVFVTSGSVLHVHAGGRVIRTTAEHPFFVVQRGWVAAHELQPGDLLVSHDGQRIPVDEVYETGQEETVYNLRVADHHTYFVGCDEWGFSVWAHNACIYHYGVSGKPVLAVGSWVTDRRQTTWAEAISIGHLVDVRARGTSVSEYMFNDTGVVINWLRGLVNGGHQGRLVTEVRIFVETVLIPPWAQP